MKSKIYNELNKFFWNSLNDEKIDVLEKCHRSKQGFFYSPIQRELFKKVLENKTFQSVLAPVFGMGILLSWMENKNIVAFEDNADIYELSQNIWENRNADIIKGNFLETGIVGKFDAIIFTSPCGWVKREGGKSNRLESEYINTSLDHLAEQGTMVVTIPNNVLTASLWHETRERILNDYSLEMVIHCGQLFSGTGVDWYTLVISKQGVASQPLW